MDEKMDALVKFGSTWWGKEWIRTMLTFGRFYRMQRGMQYAQDNRISNVIIQKGEVFALCAGTAPVPYRVKVNFQILSDQQWKKIIHRFIENLYYEAALISGDLPPNIMDLFKEEEISLFPPTTKDLTATCSCPDKEIPCKHIAALILTLAKVFDYDPFMLFKLRGMEKDEILLEIQNLISRDSNSTDKIKSKKTSKKSSKKKITKKKTTKKKSSIKTESHGIISSVGEKGDIKTENPDFLKPNSNNLEKITFSIDSVNLEQTILGRLGDPPEIEKNQDFLEAMQNIYKIVGEYVRKLLD